MSSKHIINKQPPVYDVILIVQSVLVNLAIVRGKWRALHVMGAWLSPKQASECYRGKSNY